MVRLLYFLLLLISSIHLHSHPSWGIAISTNGDIYFADVMHNGVGTVWKLDQAGNVSELLTDFHAHCLHLDKKGNLWVAENRWIQGEIEGEGEHTLIRISPDGSKETLIFTDDEDDFFGGSFAIGQQENVYFTIHNQIWDRPFNGAPKLLIDHTFERVVSIYSDDEFNLWIADKGYKNGTLFKWNKSEGLTEYATQLLPESPKNPIFEEERFHLLYDIKKDDKGNIYVCENAGRSILKVGKNGVREIFYTSEPYWYPAGIAFYQGESYIMEMGYEHRHLGPKIIKLGVRGDVVELFNYETQKKR